MNVALVDENLYVRILRNRNIPYDIRHRQFDNQNSKIRKPDIHPRHSSILTNHKIDATEIYILTDCGKQCY